MYFIQNPCAYNEFDEHLVINQFQMVSSIGYQDRLDA